MDSRQTVLVAGGAGYIGSHVCQLLDRQGFQPIVLDNLSSGQSSFVQWGPLVQADISDSNAIHQIIEDYQPVAAMHFAAFINVGESVADPAKYYHNNTVQTIQFFDLLRHAGVTNVVFSSTAAVYGEPVTDVITETHPIGPINAYGKSKWAVEQVLSDFDQAYDFRSVVFRYFNAAGADPEGRVGEAHDPETHLIPLILAAANGDRSSIKVFGSDYDTPDGTCIRDYIHVHDLALAHVLALRHLLNGGASKTYNLGNGSGYSVKDVIDVVKQVTEKSFSVEMVERRPGDPARLVSSADLVRQELGWDPEYPDLDDIVRHAWKWYQRQV